MDLPKSPTIAFSCPPPSSSSSYQCSVAPDEESKSYNDAQWYFETFSWLSEKCQGLPEIQNARDASVENLIAKCFDQETMQEFAKEVVASYFKKWDCCDFQITEGQVMVGIEPSYQGDPLKIICINREKNDSFIKTGRAFGLYGSGIRATIKQYGEYTKKCKFTKFVDKWHNKFFK